MNHQDYDDKTFISTNKKSLLGLDGLLSRFQGCEEEKSKFSLSKLKKTFYSCIMSLCFFSGIYLFDRMYYASKNDDYRKFTGPWSVNDGGLLPFHTGDCGYKIEYCLKKNFNDSKLKINSLGFPGDEIQIEKSADIYRILTVGGSTSFGGFPEFKDKLIQTTKSLNKKTRVEVINGAVIGYNSRQILQRIMHDILPLKPNMIIYGPEWNDAGSCNILTNKEHQTLNLFFIGLTDINSLKNLNPWYKEHLDVFVDKRINYSENFKRAIVKINNFTGTRMRILNYGNSIITLESSSLSDIDKPSHMDNFLPTFTLDNLVKISKICKRNNISFAVTTTPDDFEDFLTPDIPSNCLVLFNTNDWNRYNEKSLNPSIRKLSLDEELILIDLEKEFDSKSNKKKYFENGYIPGTNIVRGEFMHFNNLAGELISDMYFESVWPYIKDLP